MSETNKTTAKAGIYTMTGDITGVTRSIDKNGRAYLRGKFVGCFGSALGGKSLVRDVMAFADRHDELSAQLATSPTVVIEGKVEGVITVTKVKARDTSPTPAAPAPEQAPQAPQAPQAEQAEQAPAAKPARARKAKAAKAAQGEMAQAA